VHDDAETYSHGVSSNASNIHQNALLRRYNEPDVNTSPADVDWLHQINRQDDGNSHGLYTTKRRIHQHNAAISLTRVQRQVHLTATNVSFVAALVITLCFVFFDAILQLHNGPVYLYYTSVICNFVVPVTLTSKTTLMYFNK